MGCVYDFGVDFYSGVFGAIDVPSHQLQTRYSISQMGTFEENSVAKEILIPDTVFLPSQFSAS
jgi:hypothetical protein